MKRPDDLQKLLTLRDARLRRAEAALVQQQEECEAARAKAHAATARVIAHRQWQLERERVLLNELIGRVASINAIERVRAAFAVFDEQRADLERAEREADQATRAALELRQALAADRDCRRREHDKMSNLAAAAWPGLRRRMELLAEVDQEERVCGASSAESP